jgi:hypothetical protein
MKYGLATENCKKIKKLERVDTTQDIKRNITQCPVIPHNQAMNQGLNNTSLHKTLGYLEAAQG